MCKKTIPEQFIRWAYIERGEIVKRYSRGELSEKELLNEFLRHTPVLVTHGPAGLNASIKGVGLIPKPEHLETTLETYLDHINRGWHKEYTKKGLEILQKTLYNKNYEKIDPTKLGMLEMAKKHTWQNLRSDPRATILFYQPPTTSYELRGHVEIHEEGSIYHKLVNAQHDVYHKPNPEQWPNRPAYIFTIQEIYNNSATREGFGKRIY